ncbi:MAG TPA: DUF1801 domain-containing protein [Flavobacteriales bacterium]|nr:DUF1801 domain-containing protein [Flavobacteriales bacterium]
MPATKPATIKAYIAAAPKEGQKHLKELYDILKKVAPKAREGIKWGSPVFEENRILFAFTAFKKHVNFMPTGPTLQEFKKELEGFKCGKDTVQFPYDRPLPKALIKQIAQYRAHDVRENDAKWMY